MKVEPRTEAQVVESLIKLVRSPGYIHAVAKICFRDNVIIYADELKGENLDRLHNRDRLLRTELSTILGFMVQGAIDFSIPTSDVMDQYIDQTDKLMRELHDAFNEPSRNKLKEAIASKSAPGDIWQGEAMREPIFYGSESAYPFQYRDLAVQKYQQDDTWLLAQKGFTVTQAVKVAKSVSDILDDKLNAMMREAAKVKRYPDTFLPYFEFGLEEIAGRSGESIDCVSKVVDAFLLKGSNEGFQKVSDFNAFCASPLIRMDEKTFVLFSPYDIYQAIYESPFYWMIRDAAYKSTADAHRGDFTEAFAEARLVNVFGRARVYRGVNVKKSKGVIHGEIDVLVVYGDVLVIVQAKSKKLTLEARRGNDGQLKKDFAAAIQDSYDQAWLCAEAITEGGYKLESKDGLEIALPSPPKRIYIFNIIAENYPALAFQSRQYLTYRATTVIKAPFVMDVFLLDAMTEMLETPLRLLSYTDLRVKNIERIALSHELTALGFHLKRNLWVENEFDFILLDDDISSDLDAAMMVRREGLPGKRTPEGILTKLSGTLFEHLIHQIENDPHIVSLEVGFFLLTMHEDSARDLNQALEAITAMTRADGARHDFSMGCDVDEENVPKSGGITFHCNSVVNDEAKALMANHCELRKYAQRANQWFGVSISQNGNLQFGVALRFDWRQSAHFDEVTAGMAMPSPASELKKMIRENRPPKVGRNDKCPCGSGKKFKKCCLASGRYK